MSEDIKVQQDGKVLRVTLNRPDAGNGMTDAMVTELKEIIEAAPKTSRVVVFRGAGPDFCIGRAPGRPSAPPSNEALVKRRGFQFVFDCYGAFRACPIPIINAVQGKALGLGCALSALSDITIASDKATFQVPEMAHNILPGMVLSALIDRVPRKAIMYLVHSTAAISVERALSFGIVSEVAPAADLDAVVEATVAAILKAPAIATEGVKEFVSRAMDMDVHGAVDFARNLHAVINASSEMKG
ncbi:MAG: enoyl-CoA hydratase/isomerase family protein [Hyphomicrobiaceae bacterium]